MPSSWSNTPTRWGPVAQLLHWVFFLLIASQFLLVTLIDFSERGAYQDALYWTHKSIGVTLLLLIVVRIVWRLINPIPADPNSVSRSQMMAAHAVHYGLYAALIVMPISGYLWVVAGDYPISLFGIPVPELVGKNKALSEIAEEVHGITGWIIALLLALHVGAALYHQFVVKDNLISRMLPLKAGQPDTTQSSPPGDD